jgi:hypothetical protein
MGLQLDGDGVHSPVWKTRPRADNIRSYFENKNIRSARDVELSERVEKLPKAVRGKGEREKEQGESSWLQPLDEVKSTVKNGYAVSSDSLEWESKSNFKTGAL